ncbi:hypothetical protein D3C86_1427250 [compost metagenome]
MGLGLHDHRRLLAVVLPPDDRLRQFHVDDARIFRIAQSKDGPARLNIVQRRHHAGEGLQPRPVVDVIAAAVFINRLVALGHLPLLGLTPDQRPLAAARHARNCSRRPVRTAPIGKAPTASRLPQ